MQPRPPAVQAGVPAGKPQTRHLSTGAAAQAMPMAPGSLEGWAVGQGRSPSAYFLIMELACCWKISSA